MTSQLPRIGLIGDGAAADAYAAAIDQMAGAELVRASPATLLADPSITGVIVATPAAERAGATLAALEQGKQVLVDAPLTASTEQLDQLRQAARAAGGSLVVAHPWRFHDVYRSFRASLDAGELGAPAFFHWVSEGNATWGDDDQGQVDGPAARATAGIDLALWLLGDSPVRVYAKQTASDGITISVRFQGGANALIEHRPTLPADGPGYGFAWLLGPRGEVRWDQRADGLTVSGGRSAPPLDVQSCLGDQVSYAIACWRGPIDPASEVMTERRLVTTTAAANESVRAGRPVKIATNDEGQGR